jgi:hypothetical protein
MDYKKEATRQNAEELFANYFVKGMKNKDITSFKKDYKTLYRNVIIPMVEFLIEKQSKLHLDAVSVAVCGCNIQDNARKSFERNLNECRVCEKTIKQTDL